MQTMIWAEIWNGLKQVPEYKQEIEEAWIQLYFDSLNFKVGGIKGPIRNTIQVLREVGGVPVGQGH